MSKYPEHDKLKANDREHVAIQHFLDHLLDDRRYILAKWGDGIETNAHLLLPERIDRADLVASFFGVDRNALEREKSEMIDTAIAAIGKVVVSEPESPEGHSVWASVPKDAIVGLDLALRAFYREKKTGDVYEVVARNTQGLVGLYRHTDTRRHAGDISAATLLEEFERTEAPPSMYVPANGLELAAGSADDHVVHVEIIDRYEPRPTFDPNFCARMFGYRDFADVHARANGTFHALDQDVPFESRTEARDECFMADGRRIYTYGVDRNARAYVASPFHPEVRMIMNYINDTLGTSFNVCVLNRYRNERQALGWHSDDSPEQDQSHPIAVVSFGAPRAIWIRRIGQKGAVPPEDTFMLTPGSLFLMPGGYQQTHQHRIPKPGSVCGPRISLTFRKLDR